MTNDKLLNLLEGFVNSQDDYVKNEFYATDKRMLASAMLDFVAYVQKEGVRIDTPSFEFDAPVIAEAVETGWPCLLR